MTPLKVDLRSDTVTQPTPGMRHAIASAVVGDEQRGEDPTVSALEQRVAHLLGKEDAIFVPSATMANHIAATLHGGPGDQFLAENQSHVLVAELGGAAVHAGLLARGLAGKRGMPCLVEITRAVGLSAGPRAPRTSMIVLENTHNVAGGAVLPQDRVEEVANICCREGIALHLDGSRLMHAAVARKCSPRTLAEPFDTVTICLSKALGCPAGALIAGPASLMPRARRQKHLLGGAMRQAGILAAAGEYALDHHVERLAVDHRRAACLARGLMAAGVAVVDGEHVETNVVQIDVASHGSTCAAVLSRLRRTGIGLSTTPVSGVLRAVTHMDIDDEGIDQAITEITKALRGAHD